MVAVGEDSIVKISLIYQFNKSRWSSNLKAFLQRVFEHPTGVHFFVSRCWQSIILLMAYLLDFTKT